MVKSDTRCAICKEVDNTLVEMCLFNTTAGVDLMHA